MLHYIPGGLESQLNNKDNAALVMEIDREFYSSCVKAGDHDARLQAALKRLADAGEPQFAQNIGAYLYADA